MIQYIDDDVCKNELQRGYSSDVDDVTELYYFKHLNDEIEISTEVNTDFI